MVTHLLGGVAQPAAMSCRVAAAFPRLRLKGEMFVRGKPEALASGVGSRRMSTVWGTKRPRQGPGEVIRVACGAPDFVRDGPLDPRPHELSERATTPRPSTRAVRNRLPARVGELVESAVISLDAVVPVVGKVVAAGGGSWGGRARCRCRTWCRSRPVRSATPLSHFPTFQDESPSAPWTQRPGPTESDHRSSPGATVLSYRVWGGDSRA